MKKKIAKSLEHFRANPKKVLLLLVGIYVLFWLFFDDYGVVKRVRMELEHRQLLERQEAEQRKLLDNALRIQHARDPDSIEKAARERYNFRREGETLFILKKSNQ